ncbi:Probable cell division protein ytgP [uncultured Clostridium sp.]|nr:Probable cell division protein ytgP [uncultured Clostridium sp.]
MFKVRAKLVKRHMSNSEVFMKENSIGRGVIILAISSIILKLLSALYMPILSHILTDDGIAIYTVGYDVFIFLFAITSLGIQPAITKLVSEERTIGSDKDVFNVLFISKKFLLFYGGIASIVFALLAKPLSILFNSNDSIKVFIFLSPAILLASILAAYRGFFQGYNDMITLSISNIIEQLFNVIFSLFFAFQLINISTSWGSTGGTIGTTLGAIGAITYIKYILNKKYDSKFISKNTTEDKYTRKLHNNKILKRLLISAVPFILIAAIQNISAIVDVFTVRTFIETDINIKTATLKYYTTIINVPLVIITSLGIGVFPKIIKGYLEKNKKELVTQTAYCYKLTYIITIPSVCGLMILSKDIFKLVFNREFGYEILLIGAVALIFMALFTIQNIVLQGMNKFKFIIKLGLISLIIKTLINIIFIRINNINVIGAVIGSIVSLAVVTVCNHIGLQEYFNIKIPIINQSKTPLIASIIMSIVLLTLRYKLIAGFISNNYTRINICIVTFGLILIGGIIYFLSLLLLGGISKYELDTISPVIYRRLPVKLKNRIVKII